MNARKGTETHGNARKGTAGAIAASPRGPGYGSEWREARLGDVVELKRGYDLPQAERRPGPIPIVSSSGITDQHSEAMVKGPGVVTGRYGTLGQVFFVREDFWPLNTTLYVRDFKGNDPRWVSYFLRTLDFLAYSDKAAVPGVNRNHLHQAHVGFPVDVGEQRAIAAILGALDEKIDLNRRMSETLEAIARALFKSWFVDFDPVRAKVEGRDPAGSEQGVTCFPSSFEELERGPVPKGWRWRPVSDLAGVFGGSTPKTGEDSFWSGGDIFWATPKDMAPLSCPVLLETERRITALGLDQIGSGLLPRETVLMSSRAPIGYLAIAEVPLAVNQGIIAMVSKPEVPASFLLRWAESAQDDIVSRANGSTFLEISKGNFRSIPVLDPGPAVLAEFGRIAGPLHDRVANVERESRTLAALRDTLLPKLISGELRIPDAERIVGQVA